MRPFPAGCAFLPFPDKEQTIGPSLALVPSPAPSPARISFYLAMLSIFRSPSTSITMNDVVDSERNGALDCCFLRWERFVNFYPSRAVCEERYPRGCPIAVSPLAVTNSASTGITPKGEWRRAQKKTRGMRRESMENSFCKMPAGERLSYL